MLQGTKPQADEEDLRRTMACLDDTMPAYAAALSDLALLKLNKGELAEAQRMFDRVTALRSEELGLVPAQKQLTRDPDDCREQENTCVADIKPCSGTSDSAPAMVGASAAAATTTTASLANPGSSPSSTRATNTTANGNGSNNPSSSRHSSVSLAQQPSSSPPSSRSTPPSRGGGAGGMGGGVAMFARALGGGRPRPPRARRDSEIDTTAKENSPSRATAAAVMTAVAAGGAAPPRSDWALSDPSGRGVHVGAGVGIGTAAGPSCSPPVGQLPPMVAAAAPQSGRLTSPGGRRLAATLDVVAAAAAAEPPAAALDAVAAAAVAATAAPMVTPTEGRQAARLDDGVVTATATAAVAAAAVAADGKAEVESAEGWECDASLSSPHDRPPTAGSAASMATGVVKATAGLNGAGSTTCYSPYPSAAAAVAAMTGGTRASGWGSQAAGGGGGEGAGGRQEGGPRRRSGGDGGGGRSAVAAAAAVMELYLEPRVAATEGEGGAGGSEEDAALRATLGECTHVLEVYDLTTDVRTSHLQEFVSELASQEGRPLPVIKWVDDNHALLVCPDGATALYLLQLDQDTFRLRAFAEASPASRAVAATDLLPPRERPKTTAVVAKRLLSHALGMSQLRDREAEKDLAGQRRAAREARREREQKLAAAWDDD